MPNILITNDDGINAPGAAGAGEEGLARAWDDHGCMAPSRERSAAAQSLTLRQPIYCDQIAEREYSIDGTPADAMILAFHHFAGREARISRFPGSIPAVTWAKTSITPEPWAQRWRRRSNRTAAVAVSVAYKGRGIGFAPAAHFTRGAPSAGAARGIAGGRDAERECAAGLDRGSAYHAAIFQDHAQCVEAGYRSSRAAIFLVERAAV